MSHNHVSSMDDRLQRVDGSLNLKKTCSENEMNFGGEGDTTINDKKTTTVTSSESCNVKKRRLLMNRASAKKRRDNRRCYLRELENKVNQLQDENYKLRANNDDIRRMITQIITYLHDQSTIYPNVSIMSRLLSSHPSSIITANPFLSANILLPAPRIHGHQNNYLHPGQAQISSPSRLLLQGTAQQSNAQQRISDEIMSQILPKGTNQSTSRLVSEHVGLRQEASSNYNNDRCSSIARASPAYTQHTARRIHRL